MDKYIDCYVLYCTEDKTYMTSDGLWTKDILAAVRYMILDKAREAKRHYDKTIKIMNISMTINGVILNQE